MHIGLYFGTFNPIHKGHLAIAEGMYKQGFFEAIWLVVSPNNPFKAYPQWLNEHKRLELVNIAIKELPYCLASDIEFKMKRPSYTYLTLRKLQTTYPFHTFSIIMGEDNWNDIEKWKNYEEIIQNHSIYVYPRAGVLQKKEQENVFYIDLPLLNISSSHIRERLKQGKSIEDFVHKDVIKVIEKMRI